MLVGVAATAFLPHKGASSGNRLEQGSTAKRGS